MLENVVNLNIIIIIVVNTEVLQITHNLKYSIHKETPAVFRNGLN